MVGPWIHSLWERITNLLNMEGDEDLMSDIMFLCVKEFQGKLRQSDANQTATGDGATLTANTGKDMYLARAKCNIMYAAGTSTSCTIELKINGVTVETFDSQGIHGTSSASNLNVHDHEFDIGYKVAAGQIIKLEVTAESNMEINTSIQCFEETTGVSPRLPAQTQGTATIVGGIAGSLGFIAKKENDGKVRTNEGTTLGSTGDLATLTANTGKDMYISSAKVAARHDASGATVQKLQVELKVNGVVKETFITTMASSTAGLQYYDQYEFKNIGLKVATGEVIKLEVVTIGTDIEAEGFIQTFEENTGVDPTA